MTARAIEESPPLLLTEGGPGDAVLRRLRLAPASERARHAAVVLAAVTWIPLLVLSAIDGVAVAGVRIPFLHDLAVHVRFLVALPVLVLAEISIGGRLRQAAAQFVAAGLVRAEEQPRFAAVVRRTLGLRDSRLAALVVLGAAIVTTYAALTTAVRAGSTWHAGDPIGGMTAAGYWYAFVSLPIFQFLLYRWGYRMIVWAWFLRQLARLDLQLTPTHPDGTGGLGFLGKACIPFGTLLFAVSAVVSSAIATRVLFAAAPLGRFRTSYAGLVVIAVVVFVGPLVAFVPVLVRVKRRGLAAYGALASRYTQRFERKWVSGADPGEDVLGTADIQSLADLGNGYELVRKMRVLPIEGRDLVSMVLPGVVPAIPLAATVMPVSDVVNDLIRLLL